MRHIILLLLLTVVFQLNSQVSFYNTFPFHSNAGDTRYVSKTNDGGYVILRTDWGNPQTNYFIKVVKTDFNGIIQWVSSTTLNNTMNPYEGLTGMCVKQTSDGGYIIAGNSNLASNAELILIKLNASGNLTWNRYIGNQSTSIVDYGRSVVQTSDGGYIMVGTDNFSSTNSVLSVVRTNSVGTITWYRRLLVSGKLTKGYSISNTNDGGYFITGTIGTGANVLLVKTDQNFNITWSKSYNQTTSENIGTQTSDGEFIVVSNSSTQNAHLLKVKSDGTLKWNKSYNNSGSANFGNFVSETTDKGFIGCGFSNGFAPNFTDGTIFKTDSLGNISFFKTVGDSSNIYAVQQCGDKGFVLVGNQFHPGGKNDPLFIKTDSLGIVPCGVVNQTITTTTPSITVLNETITNVLNPPYNTGTLSLNHGVSTNTNVSVLCAILGINENHFKNDYKIFPNPTNGIFTIYPSIHLINPSIKIYSTLGTLLSHEKTLLNDQIQIDISQYPSGIYIVEIFSNGYASKHKLIKD